MNYTMQDIARICAGKLAGSLSGADRRITSLLTDSRNIEADEETLFFAINTGANSGLRYVPDIYRRGVRGFVVEKLPEMELNEATYIVVDSVVGALQALGTDCRRNYEGLVIGVTGSKGKTLVKEWLYTALEDYCQVTRSPLSYNSQIGVPLSLWQLSEQSDVAIIEGGISREGEMEVIAPMINPRIAVITCVGGEHDEGFGSLSIHASQKALFGIGAESIVFNADDRVVASAVKMLAAEEKLLICFSRKDEEAPVYVKSERINGNSAIITYVYKGNEESLVLPFTERWMLDDALLVLCTLLLVGMEPARASWAMKELHPMRTRIDVSDGVNDCLIAYDEFTCNLNSLENALDFINRRADEQGRSRTLVLAGLHQPNMDEQEVCRRINSLLGLAGVKRFIGASPLFIRNRGLLPPDAELFESPAALMKSLSTSDFENEYVLIKGNPGCGLESLRVNLEARTHETVLEVNLDSIVKNYNYFRSKLPASSGLIAMVKASGYGAGSLEIAKTLQAQGAAYLAVAVIDEGIELRRAGISMPIMVMNPKVLNYRAMFAYDLEPEIFSLDMLRDVIREAEKAGITGYPVHIKLDTGMHRVGFNPEEFDELLALLETSPQVKVSTLFSHLATADCPDMDEHTLLQLKRFGQYASKIMHSIPYGIKRHILNTAGILRFPGHHYDFARLGIGLYGIRTLPPEMEAPLATVSSLRSVIIAVKEREAGEAIGYARRDLLKHKSTIATIPIGYADGMNRRFGNGRIKVNVNGHEAPTIGNICMDACMIDVTGIPCRPGDPVEIFGETMPVQRLADVLDTIPYEILTSVSPRVKRVYFRE